jgi:hypothetical protein
MVGTHLSILVKEKEMSTKISVPYETVNLARPPPPTPYRGRICMELLKQAERDVLSWKSFYALPLSLVLEAQKLAVSIDDICINALKQKI